MITYTFLFDSLATELQLFSNYLKKINNRKKYSELYLFAALLIWARKLAYEEGAPSMPPRGLVVSLLGSTLMFFNSKNCEYPLKSQDMDWVMENFLPTYAHVIQYDIISTNKGIKEGGAYLLQKVFDYKTTDTDLLELFEYIITRLTAIYLISKVIHNFKNTQEVTEYEIMFNAHDNDTSLTVYAKYKKYSDALFEKLNFRDKLTSTENAKIFGAIALAYLQAANLMDGKLFD